MDLIKIEEDLNRIYREEIMKNGKLNNFNDEAFKLISNLNNVNLKLQAIRNFFSKKFSSDNERKYLFDVYNSILFQVMNENLVEKPKCLETLFFPSIESRDKLLLIINLTQKELKLKLSNFNDEIFAKNLIDLAFDKKIMIKILVKNFLIKNDEFLKRFSNKCFKIKKDLSEENDNQFAIIDEKILISGSFNWDFYSEEKNTIENVIIIENENICKKFNSEFEENWKIIPDNESLSSQTNSVFEEEESNDIEKSTISKNNHSSDIIFQSKNITKKKKHIEIKKKKKKNLDKLLKLRKSGIKKTQATNKREKRNFFSNLKIFLGISIMGTICMLSPKLLDYFSF